MCELRHLMVKFLCIIHLMVCIRALHRELEKQNLFIYLCVYIINIYTYIFTYIYQISLYEVMHHLSVGILSENCVLRHFHSCVNIMVCTYTSLDDVAHFTSMLHIYVYLGTAVIHVTHQWWKYQYMVSMWRHRFILRNRLMIMATGEPKICRAD